MGNTRDFLSLRRQVLLATYSSSSSKLMMTLAKGTGQDENVRKPSEDIQQHLIDQLLMIDVSPLCLLFSGW